MKLLIVIILALTIIGFIHVINTLQEDIEKSCNNSGGSYLSGRCIHF